MSNEVTENTAEKTSAAKTSSRAGIKQISTAELPKKTLETCLAVAKPIHEIYAGGSASWDELASSMGISPKSASTKYLIWGAQAYELIRKEGDKFHLSETGRKLLAPNYPEERSEAAIKAVMIPTLQSKFYTEYDGKLLPEDEFLDNVLENRYAIPRERTAEAKEVLLTNAEFAGILRHHANGKRTIRLDGVSLSTEDISAKNNKKIDSHTDQIIYDPTSDTNTDILSATQSPAEKICFFVTPIGEDGSNERKHADMMLKHLIEPAFAEFNIKVVRADTIGKSGLISQQIFEHIISAKFCVADLSFGNPNAFYELGVRHMTRLPTIQIIRKGDKIPFDVAQGRTIVVDVSDIYTLLDRIQSAKKELIEHIRNYMNPQDVMVGDDNPITIYLPGLQVKLPKVTLQRENTD